MTAQDFWDNRDEAQRVMQELTSLRAKVRSFAEPNTEFIQISELWQLAQDEDASELESDIRKGLQNIEKVVSDLELAVLLSDKYDGNDAIIALHSGAGGVDAMDWVEMMYRMYMRWAERRGFKTEVYDILVGEEAGIKNVTIAIEGENAYGYLKAEKGIHRMVRISPFDAAAKRHTSFASVDVLPQLDEEQEEPIDDQDLRIDTFRAGGKGGQHLNKTDSAVRITHLPTGIVVSCQNERSQHANKRAAMRVLQAKLLVVKRKEQEQELGEIRGNQQEIAWGSQIRSYVFNPYQMVKDHRTGIEAGNVEAVLDGELDEFISGYLRELARLRV
jgi:peptide chain release factor 2